MATRYAWLIETEKEGGLKYRDMDCFGQIIWTSDPYKAMNFSRRMDAEKFAEGDEGDVRIVEHAFEEAQPANGIMITGGVNKQK